MTTRWSETLQVIWDSLSTTRSFETLFQPTGWFETLSTTTWFETHYGLQTPHVIWHILTERNRNPRADDKQHLDTWTPKNRDQQAGDLAHFDKQKKKKKGLAQQNGQVILTDKLTLTGTKGAGRSKGRQAWRLRPLPQCRKCLRTNHLLIRNILLWDISNPSLPPPHPHPPPPDLQWCGSEEAWRRKRCNQCL